MTINNRTTLDNGICLSLISLEANQYRLSLKITDNRGKEYFAQKPIRLTPYGTVDDSKPAKLNKFHLEKNGGNNNDSKPPKLNKFHLEKEGGNNNEGEGEGVRVGSPKSGHFSGFM